ncbi:PKD domain-containing protein [Actinophytocola glycyrrhizae]|uniref:PKD domain-containing protein n=1 Tax=Actinophytocola glycyrrhizae TaxID=2044873 RepID=A0ABV9RUF5_9PSEU
MRHHPTRRPRLAAFAAAAGLVLLTPGTAAAAPPGADDFDHAVAITALPFEQTVDTGAATAAADDPRDCYGYAGKSVWFSYTAQADGYVQATITDAAFTPVLSAYTGTRGALAPVPGMCAMYTGDAETFPVAAGTTYHLLVQSAYPPYAGEVTLRLRGVPAAPNDDVAAAERVPGLPTSSTADLDRSSAAPDEVPPSCDPSATRSVWYSYTPSSARWVGVKTGNESTAVSVHHGTALSEVDCEAEYGWAVFRAEVGETYLIRVASSAEDASQYYVDFRTAPALAPRAAGSHAPDTVFRPAAVHLSSGDPMDQPVVSAHLDFGDGTAIELADMDTVEHQYTEDGDYTLTLSVTTADGRSATGTSVLRVESHDVGISAFTAPAKARVDTTKQITVAVTNTRYDERVTVTLRKRTDGSGPAVGTLTQTVPKGATVTFPFAYTFGPDDVGTVTFDAVAGFTWPAEDDNPDDNTATATTTVRP